VLAWHVDYWNKLGQGQAMGAWVDPFSSAAASQRQSAYARAWAERSRWTPQWRVEGKSLRSRRWGELVQTAVKEGTVQTPTLALEVAASWAPPKPKSDKHATVTVRIVVKVLKKGLKLPDTVKVLPLLVQRKAVTAIPRGENRGKTLTEFYIVRTIGKALAVKDTTSAKGVTITLKAPRDQKAKNLGLAVLVEDRATMRPLESQFVSLTVAKPKPKPDHSEGQDGEDF
jgi:hypothetical protein